MYTKFALIALLALTGASAKSAKNFLQTSVPATKASTPAEWQAEVQREGKPVDWYNCADHADGDYNHPNKCDHFIACVAQTHAYEMPCAPMDGNGNLLHFVQNSGPDTATSRCDYPENAHCEATEPTEGTDATEPTTTETATNSTTQRPAECNPDDCQLKGNCTHYFHCDDGQWAPRDCGTDLFWNPNAQGSGPLHGGTCDFWDNLDKETQDGYLEDETCISKCEWSQTEDQVCTGKYNYRSPFDGKLSGRETTLECPEGLIWLGEPALSCGHCSDRKDRNCCGTEETTSA